MLCGHLHLQQCCDCIMMYIIVCNVATGSHVNPVVPVNVTPGDRLMIRFHFQCSLSWSKQNSHPNSISKTCRFYSLQKSLFSLPNICSISILRQKMEMYFRYTVYSFHLFVWPGIFMGICKFVPKQARCETCDPVNPFSQDSQSVFHGLLQQPEPFTEPTMKTIFMYKQFFIYLQS